jgi:uncharacterized membrane protein YdjX (TVP38/TMEM64 family)
MVCGKNTVMNRNAVHGLLGLTLFGVIRLAVAWNERLDVAALQAWIESAGAAAPLVLVAAYAAVTVLFICRTDRRSAQAAQVLADAGFIDALPVRGGMTAWHAKGWQLK